MDFALTETQELLSDMVANFLGREMSAARLRTSAVEGQFDRALWGRMAEQGWLALGLASAEGGLIEQTLVCRSVGYHAAPIPLVSTLASLTALQRAGAESALLKPIVLGLRVVPFVDGREAVTIDRAGSTVRLSGNVSRVPYGAVADGFAVLVNGLGGRSEVCLVDADAVGLARRPRESIGYDAATSLHLSQVATKFVSELDPVSTDAVDLHRALCAASEGLGAAERSVELAVDYAKTRSQFGRPIGAFQAVQHDIADMAVSVDGMRFVLHEAAWSFDEEPGSAGLLARMALTFAHKALTQVTSGSHEVFGGVGFFVEHELHYYTRRIAMDLSWMGRRSLHLEALATAIGI